MTDRRIFLADEVIFKGQSSNSVDINIQGNLTVSETLISDVHEVLNTTQEIIEINTDNSAGPIFGIKIYDELGNPFDLVYDSTLDYWKCQISGLPYYPINLINPAYVPNGILYYDATSTPFYKTDIGFNFNDVTNTLNSDNLNISVAAAIPTITSTLIKNTGNLNLQINSDDSTPNSLFEVEYSSANTDLLKIDGPTKRTDLYGDLYLNNGGTLYGNVNTVQIKEVSTTPYNLEVAYNLFYVDTSVGDIQINLPAITGNETKYFKVVKFSPLNSITFDTNGAETILSNDRFIMEKFEVIDLIPRGTDWKITNNTLNFEPSHNVGFGNRENGTISITNVAAAITCTITANLPMKIYSETNGLHIFPSGSKVKVYNAVGSGKVYFYLDENYVLQASTNYDVNTLLVGSTYYNATTTNLIGECKELHSNELSKSIHSYLHNSVGTSFGGGFIINNDIEDGANDSGSRCWLTSGVIYDEDIKINITNGVLNSDYRMPLGSNLTVDPLKIKILHKVGISGEWEEYTNVNNQLFIPGATYATYNENNGGTWQLSDLIAGQRVNLFLICTNSQSNPVTGILGQTTSGTLSTILEEQIGDLDLNGFPYVEFTGLYKITLRSRSTYSNTNKTAIEVVTDIRNNRSVTSESGITNTSHSSLSDLGYDLSGHTGFQKETHTAIINPTVNDDVNLGYKIGQLWLNTSTNEVFICESNTDGAAVWNPFLTSSDNLTVNTMQSAGDFVFTLDYDNNDVDSQFIINNGLDQEVFHVSETGECLITNNLYIEGYIENLPEIRAPNNLDVVIGTNVSANTTFSVLTSDLNQLFQVSESGTTFITGGILSTAQSQFILKNNSATGGFQFKDTSNNDIMTLAYDGKLDVLLSIFCPLYAATNTLSLYCNYGLTGGNFIDLYDGTRFARLNSSSCTYEVDTISQNSSLGTGGTAIHNITNENTVGATFPAASLYLKSTNSTPVTKDCSIRIIEVDPGLTTKMSLYHNTTESIYIRNGGVYMPNMNAGTGNDVQLASGQLVYVSSLRAHKQNVIDYDIKSLDLINKLRIRKYSRKTTPEISEIGLIAEELQESLEDDIELSEMFLTRNEEGNLTGFKQSLFHFVLLDAVKELNEKNKELEDQNLELLKNIQKLEMENRMQNERLSGIESKLNEIIGKQPKTRRVEKLKVYTPDFTRK